MTDDIVTRLRESIDHIVSLGFACHHAESIAGMDLDSETDRDEHLNYILQCDAADITSWIGIRPEVKA